MTATMRMMSLCLMFTAVCFLIGNISFASAKLCPVSLRQNSDPACTAIRDADLAQDKETFTLKVDESIHGFALLNMTIPELIQVIKKDPFMRTYTSQYVEMVRVNDKILAQYNSTTHGQEINDISEYLPLFEFFQSTPEPLLGEKVRLASKYEDFIDDQPAWISDKYFTQQRLAGTNPKSLKRVSIPREAEEKCTIKTIDGRSCHVPFKYRGQTYHQCTKKDYHVAWCSMTEEYKGRWGVCAEISDSKGCGVKTTKGEWCHFPFMYKWVKYESCVKVGNRKSWCATKPIYNRYRGWGYCAEKEEEEEVEGPIGLDWSKLKQTLNPDFDWDKAVQGVLKSDDVSLEDAIKQNLIYALRYEECDDLPRSEDITDNDSRRTMWDFLSPIALFASARLGEKNELVPVAIQMDHKPESDVFTPKDGDNWLIAKVNVQITDIGYAQLVEHLGKLHFFIEPFCVSLKRTLPDMHPLNQILKYHCREVIVPNAFGTPAIVGEKQATDQLFAYGNTGAVRLLQLAHPSAIWEITDFRRDIKKRGLDNKGLLPYYPYRDDGEPILGVIESLAEKYVDLYYDNDEDVQNDDELQAYVNEVSLDGTGPDGGIGRIKGFPASVHSKRELCHIVSRIICHLTIHHAAINYGVADYASYIPNQPTKLYNDTRVEPGTFSVYRLPNRVTSAFAAGFNNRLSTFRFDSLFDYGNELQDPKAVKLVNEHYCYLMNVVQPKLEEENRKRKERAQLTYPKFIPRWLPNGIQT